MDLSFDSVDSVYELMDWTYDLTNLQYKPTNRESDLTDYNTYVSTASVCAQTEAFDPVNSVYQSMEPTYGLTGLQCEPTSFSHTPIYRVYYLKHYGLDTRTEEPFEQTEGKAWKLLAARIPQELFDDILFYVNVDRVSQRREYLRDNGRNLTRNRGEPSPNDILTDLKQCSLVCLFWANRCREHMFSGMTLWMDSYETAEIFKRYILGGCPRLMPVHQLIKSIHVTQNYCRMWAPRRSERQTSFLHPLYLPSVQDKLKELSIEGPVPEGFNPAKLDTPHWGIPTCIVVPSSFLREIELRDVHFPSFRHVIKYVRHFSCATYIEFVAITWDGPTPSYSLPHASNKITCPRRPRSLMVQAHGGCTDPVHLALTALMMNPNCPLHRLNDEERVWMTKFMTLLWGGMRGPYVRIGFDVSEQTTTVHLGSFYFVFEGVPLTDRSASALSVVGMCAYIHKPATLLADFNALVNHARTSPSIHALVLLVDSLDHLQKFLKPFNKVFTLASETIDLVLAYEEREERKAVGVDLFTLESNGRIWTDLPVLTFDRYNNPKYHLKSLYILQRQLEKKPRGRFY